MAISLLDRASRRRAGSTRKRYLHDTGGNIAIMTSLMLGVLLVGVGAAVDYTGAAKRSNDIQNFSDAAVLAAAKSRSEDETELREIVEAVVARHNTSGWPLDIGMDLNDDGISVTISNEFDTFVMGFVGYNALPVSVESRAPRARLTPINLAIVVDTTDSMEGANIAALRTAASELVDEMEDMEAKTRLSLVPFGQYVNVGTDQGKPGGRNWIDMGNYGQQEQHCWNPKVTVVAPVCTVTGSENYDIRVDGRFMGVGTRDTRDCTDGVYEDGPEQCEMRTADWHGCMGTRNGANASKVGRDGTRFPAALDETCGSVVVPMTDQHEDIKTAIAALDTEGPTYLPSGLAWGWRTLDTGVPYTEASRWDEPQLKRAMVFMTDGINTRSKGDAHDSQNGYKHRRTNDGGADGLELTEALCDAINDDGIELFVVAYQLPETGETGSVLENCATTPGHYFTPESAGELIADFREVATMLDYTRLSY